MVIHAIAATTAQAAYYKINRNGLAYKVNPFLKEEEMFAGYYYPFYRSFPPVWGFPGYNNFSSNIIGSAIANQNMNVIGTGAIGGIQTASPTVIW